LNVALTKLLHDKDQSGGCLKACYECLLNFYNQREHETFDRRLVMPFLKNFQSVEIKMSDHDENRIISQYLLQKCGSSFETEVLYETHRRGLPFHNDSQKIIYHQDSLVAQADFYYARKNLILFIDGEPHSSDYVIKDDDRKRKELKNLGYRVYSI